ncbi:MAG: transcriptional regulator, putative ATPase, winged helix family [Bryobacterales bacterium]|nr:transcriptional regulator, putative ATPase, winged helix family [Bryobacterales bacterium]
MRRFDSFRIDTANQCLWHGEALVELTPKAFGVLRYLVENAGRLVTQKELLDVLWPATYVNPEVLRKYILEIRRALGDRLDKPVFIKTLPKRGYQFVASVTDESAAGMLALEETKRMVGRRSALAELDRCLSKTGQGQRQIVFITGEPGIGKTALVDEFQRRAASKVLSMRIARGQCVEGYGGREPYYPMLEALGGLCLSSGGESLVHTLAAQAPTWLVQFPALVKREHREMLQREILGATRERMLREIGEVLETITSENPLLLVFEDLHWADRSTVDLLSALARRRSPAKLMVVGTYRPVDIVLSDHPLKVLKQDLLVHQLCREIPLEPLGETEITEYLTSEAPETTPSEALAALLYRHSEGNPLFMVAALEHLEERGLISREHGGWQPRVALEEIDLDVPESLSRMIGAQIERLGTEEQRVLEVASLESIGRSRFGVVLRAWLLDMDPEAFEGVCETLSRRHHIVRPADSATLADGTLTACYEFVHVLYREVCYRRIAPGRRARLHRRVGEWIEERFEPLNEATTWLADHFEQGGDWLRAIKYLQLAADTAGRRFEPRQAAEILQHALVLAKNLPEAERTVREIAILEKLAKIYVALVDHVHAVESYETLAALAAHDGLIDVEVHALIDMAYPLSWTSSERSLEALERALRLSARQEDPNLRARTRARCFAWRLWQRWNPQDVEDFHNALAEVLNADNRRILAPYLADRGFVRWICSEYREARRSVIESRLILFETLKENPYLSTAYLVGQCIVLPKTLLFLGEWGEALREIKDVTAMLDKNADYLWAQSVHLNRAWVHLHAMDFAGALAICNSTLPLARHPELRPTPDWPTPRPVIRMCLFLTGSAETALGNYEGALEHLLAEQRDMDQPAIFWAWYGRIQLESALTELWLAKGDLAQARPQAESFLKIALPTAEHTWQVLAWEVNARVAIAELDLARAHDCIAKGLSAMEGFEVPLAAWRIHATAFGLYENSGDRDLAERHLALSRATIMKLANSMPAEEPLRQKFLSAPMIRKILGS